MRELRVYHRKEHERWMRDVLGLEKDFRPSRRVRDERDHSEPDREREKSSARDSERDGHHRDRYRDKGTSNGEIWCFKSLAKECALSCNTF